MDTRFYDGRSILKNKGGNVSLPEFWTSVRSASRLISPKAIPDSPRLDANRIERLLKRKNVWLTRDSVEGFEEKDFSFLSEQERRSLSESVQQFRLIAEQVSDSAPASTSQFQQAIIPFRKIVETLRPDKYADLDAFILGKKIERALDGTLPAWVHELRFETGLDVSGDRAVWIWVEMDDDAANETVFSHNVKTVKNLLETTLRKISTDWWPYVRFRTVSEQQAISR